MAVNAFISFFDKADGESVQKGKEKWVEIQGWDWELEADVNLVKSTGGLGAGKANPGKLNFEHFFDTASTVILGHLCWGKVFPKVQLQMMKNTGNAVPDTYFTMTMEEVSVTKVSNSGTEEGNVTQKVEMAFRKVSIEYKPQNSKDGTLGNPKTYNWDIGKNMTSFG